MLCIFEARDFNCVVREAQLKKQSTKNFVKHTAADFFAGSGLASEGLKSSFKVIWANDIDKNKAKTYMANHGTSYFTHSPIENLSYTEIPNHDLSWASFPCQDLSLAGKNGGIRAQRSGTVWYWLDLLKNIKSRPKIVVAENVQGLISGKNGQNYIALHTALNNLGYKCGALMLNASTWVPQSRVRIFVVGVKEDLRTEAYISHEPTWAHSNDIIKLSQRIDNFTFWNIAQPKKTSATLSDLIDFTVPYDNEKTIERNLALITEKHWQKVKNAEAQGNKVFAGYKRTRNGKQCLELRTDGIAGCLRTPAGGSSRQHLLIATESGYKTRLLSIKEAAQLMGARKSYKFPGSYNDGYKAIGDAVAVPVVKHLADCLLEPILNDN